MSKLRILIADDHRMVREGLRMALEIEQDFEVVGEAGEGSEAVRLAKELNPDVVLMDVGMPGMNGIDACQEIRNFQSKIKVLMLTASDDAESVSASLVAGAQGYFLKIGGSEELVKAVRSVGNG
ncbi:MAG: response regulator transcription factor [Chloroflexi bacterium]|nr:response regulator transcription factor [Chloroflexota bacterium]